MFILIAAGIVLFAHILRSGFWQLMSGLVSIAAGIDLVSQNTEWKYILFGVVIIVIGFYQLIIVPYDLIKGGE